MSAQKIGHVSEVLCTRALPVDIDIGWTVGSGLYYPNGSQCRFLLTFLLSLFLKERGTVGGVA